MRFVSGGDDCTVRLWSIREEAPTAVIDAKANVCSVQFSPVSSNLLAFGSANYRVYLYDLRQMQVPTLAPCPGKLPSVPAVPISKTGAISRRPCSGVALS